MTKIYNSSQRFISFAAAIVMLMSFFCSISVVAAGDSAVTQGKMEAVCKVTVSLLNSDNSVINPDEEGYHLEPDTTYKLSLVFHNENVLPQGIYTYQLPKGIELETEAGVLTAPNTAAGGTDNIGSWKIKDGVMVFEFTDAASNHAEIDISFVFDLKLGSGTTEFVFPGMDGKVTVIVPDAATPTPTTVPTPVPELPVIRKWGWKENSPGKDYDSAIAWQIAIVGSENNNVIGAEITDTIGSNQSYYYTKANNDPNKPYYADGIIFAVYDSNNKWVTSQMVYFNEEAAKLLEASGAGKFPHVHWNDDGSWSYTIPEKVGATALTAEHRYLLTYYTEPEETTDNNKYTNHTEISKDNQSASADAEVSVGSNEHTPEPTAEPTTNLTEKTVVKNNGKGGYDWTIKSVIAPMQEGGSVPYYAVADQLLFRQESKDHVEKLANIVEETPVVTVTVGNKPTVNAVYVDYSEISNVGGYQVLPKEKVGNAEYLCIPLSGDDGMIYFWLLKRCECVEHPDQCQNAYSCANVFVTANSEYTGPENKYCTCWNIKDEAKITISYHTTDEAYNSYLKKCDPGKEAKLVNRAAVHYEIPGGSGFGKIAEAELILTNTLEKEIILKPGNDNSYTAKYKIEVDTRNQTITEDVTELTVTDQMYNLQFAAGTTKVTRTVGDKIEELSPDEYTESYNNELKIATFVIKNPKNAVYTITYDTFLIDNSANATYNNRAEVIFGGTTYGAATPTYQNVETGVHTKQYYTNIKKVSEDDDRALSGAKYGLYDGNEKSLAQGTTNNDGAITFYKTEDNNVLASHTGYFLKEIAAPEGYELSEAATKFAFKCGSTGCEKCAELEKSGYMLVESGGTITVSDKAKTTPEITSVSGPILSYVAKDSNTKAGGTPFDGTSHIINGGAEIAQTDNFGRDLYGNTISTAFTATVKSYAGTVNAGDFIVWNITMPNDGAYLKKNDTVNTLWENNGFKINTRVLETDNAQRNSGAIYSITCSENTNFKVTHKIGTTISGFGAVVIGTVVDNIYAPNAQVSVTLSKSSDSDETSGVYASSYDDENPYHGKDPTYHGSAENN